MQRLPIFRNGWPARKWLRWTFATRHGFRCEASWRRVKLSMRFFPGWREWLRENEMTGRRQERLAELFPQKNPLEPLTEELRMRLVALLAEAIAEAMAWCAKGGGKNE